MAGVNVTLLGGFAAAADGVPVPENRCSKGPDSGPFSVPQNRPAAQAVLRLEMGFALSDHRATVPPIRLRLRANKRRSTTSHPSSTRPVRAF
jgi:hypothetical protein